MIVEWYHTTPSPFTIPLPFLFQQSTAWKKGVKREPVADHFEGRAFSLGFIHMYGLPAHGTIMSPTASGKGAVNYIA
jgi:hypothetical protein